MASKSREKQEDELNLFESGLVPKHDVLNAEEKAELLKKLNIKLKQLPRIKRDDAIIKLIGGRRGDVVKVARKSPVAGEYFYYRVVM